VHAPGKGRNHAVQKTCPVFQVKGASCEQYFPSWNIQALKPLILCDKGLTKTHVRKTAQGLQVSFFF
ncbi:MAG TPA: hypothetical protein PKY45_15205, partial [Deltaproteobacteria bacterium]|nr:hypothetical protein [Deltaproteobacteria bacterium]